LPPWSVEQNLREIVEFLPRYGVDELIVFVVDLDSREFTRCQRLPKWVRRYQKSLFRIRAAMEKVGIRYSINPWITQGHGDKGRDSRKDLPGLQTLVGPDGAQCESCACPLSPIWRRNVAKVWTLYAETKPHVIWVEDDIRTFGHSAVRYSCFCPEHMKRFSMRVGRRVSRKDLAAAIVKPGKPHPWRKEYLDMQGEIMAETAGFLARTVHKVSPETSMGLMSSSCYTHCLEGRRWKELGAALADGQTLYSRPPLGNYCENSLRGLYATEEGIKTTRYCMPEGTVYQTEVENCPMTTYSKSITFTFLQMAVSFALGCDGVTLNIFDSVGTPMEADPALGRMLGEKKAFLNGLARRAGESGRYRGVKLLFHEKASYFKQLERGAGYGDIKADGSPTMHMLETCGVPTTYEDSNVVASSGQVLRAFSDEDILEMLRGGMLVDGVAARVLYDRGYGRYIGVKSIEKPKPLRDIGLFISEEFHNRKFGGGPGKYMTLALPQLGGNPPFCAVAPARGAETVSRLIYAPRLKRFEPCMMAYENSLGGRVVVHGFDLTSSFGTAFNRPFRTEQMQGVVRWLARERPPLIVTGGAYPLALRKDCGRRTHLGLFNLTLDAWPLAEFEMETRHTLEKAEILSAGGRWREAQGLKTRKTRGRLTLRYERAVTYDRPLFITLHWRQPRTPAS